MSAIQKTRQQNRVPGFLSDSTAHAIGKISLYIAWINFILSILLALSLASCIAAHQPVVAATILLLATSIIINLIYIYFEARHMEIIEKKQENDPRSILPDTGKTWISHGIPGILAFFAGTIPNIPALVIAMDEFVKEAKKIIEKTDGSEQGHAPDSMTNAHSSASRFQCNDRIY